MIETVAQESQSNTQRLSSTVRTQIGLAFFAFILIGAIDAAGGVLVPSIRSFYGIDKATVSLLLISSTAGYLISAFSSGLLTHKLGVRAVMIIGPAVVALGAIVISFAPPFVALMGGFLLSGFGIGLIDAGLNSHVAGLPNNTALLNYLHAFFGVGALLGPLLATYVVTNKLQWNTPYYVWIIVGISLVIGFGLAFKGYGALAHHEEHATGERQGNVLAGALRLRVVWVAAFFLLMYVGIEVSLGFWGFSFLTEERHEAKDLAGLAISGYWLGLTIGRVTLGKVAERLGNRRLIELCLVGVVVGLLLVWLVPVGWVMAVGLWLAGFSLGPIFPTTIAMMPGLVPARVLPSAIGFLASFGSMGVALLPAAVGVLAERVGLWVLMPYCIVLTAILLGLWWALQRQQRAVESLS
jgi:fucose permease